MGCRNGCVASTWVVSAVFAAAVAREASCLGLSPGVGIDHVLQKCSLYPSASRHLPPPRVASLPAQLDARAALTAVPSSVPDPSNPVSSGAPEHAANPNGTISLPCLRPFRQLPVMFSVICELHPPACRIEPRRPSSHLFPTCSPTSSLSSLLSVSGTFQALPRLCNSLCLGCPPSSSSSQVCLILILQGSPQVPPSERPALTTPSE